MTHFFCKSARKALFQTQWFTIFFLTLVGSIASAQSFEASYGAPSTPLQVCGADAQFKVKIYAGSSAINGVSLRVTLPAGYAYTDGSAVYITGGTGTITDTQISSNVYDLTVSIPATGFIELSYRAAATCEAIGSAGDGFVNYTLRSGTGTPALPANVQGSSDAVNFLNAKLVISGVTNQNFSAVLGSSYTRDITIKNTGYGSITGINLSSSNTTGLTITSPSVLSTTGTGSATLAVSGTASNQVYTIAGITLAKDQQIIIRENVSVTSCAATTLTTNYDAYFGCTAKCTVNDVNGTETAGASVTVPQPNIVYNSSSVTGILCRGTDQQQMFSYKNNGAGSAKNVSFTIVNNNQGSSTMDFNPAYTDVYRFGFKNFEYQIGSTSGAWTAVSNTNNIYYDNSSGTCLANVPGKTTVSLPELAPGAIVYIRYIEVSCCVDACLNDRNMLTTNAVVQFAYNDICGTALTTTPTKVRAGTGFYNSASGVLPSDMVAGQTYDFDWALSFTGSEVTYDNGKFSTSTTFPDGVILPTASQATLTLANGSTVLTPSSFTINGRTVTVVYNLTGSFGQLNGAHFKFTALGFDCAGVTGSGSVEFDMFATAPSCGCTMQIHCSTYPIGTHCATCPKGGLAFKNFAIKRISYGLGDSNNDKIPDGNIDLSKIRTDFAMRGDTLEAVLNGTFVAGSSTLPILTHAYATTTFTNQASDMGGLNAQVEIYVGGSATPTYTTNSPLPMTYTSGVGSVDFSIDVLHAHGIPSTYTQFATGDKVVVKSHFVVTGGTAAAAANILVNLNNAMYASDIANPTSDADKYSCDSFSGSFRLFLYSIAFDSSVPYTSGICSDVSVTSFYSIELGQYQTKASNYFPYEYRPISFPATWTASVPTGYTYKSAILNYTSSTPNSAIAVTPVDISARPLVFNLAPYFANGTITIADEAYNAILAVTYAVDCNTPNGNSAINFSANLTNAPNAKAPMPASYNSFTNSRQANYTPGDIEMASSQAVITTTSGTVNWVVSVKNANSGVYAGIALPNTWLASQSASGLAITSVQALASETATSGTAITASNGIYQLGALAGNATTKYYLISASLSECNTANLNLAYGYACTGYPNNLPSAICKENFALTAIAQPLSLQLTVIAQPATTAKYDLCDIVSYELEVLNPSQTTGSDLKVIATLPSQGGIAYEPGTYQLRLPGSSSYFNLSDANVSVNGGTIVFTIPAGSIASLGSSQSYRIKFQVRTTACEFISGSSLRFAPSGLDLCGATKRGDNQQSNPIRLNGAPDTYNTFTITSDATAVVACSAGNISSSYHYRMVNQNAATAIIYNFSVEIPAPWTMQTSALTYTAGSYAGVSYTNSVPSTSGGTIYNFSVPAGMPNGAFVDFTVALTAPSATAVCGLSAAINEQVTLSFQTTCSVDQTVCTTKQIVSEHTGTQINVNLSQYSISDFTASLSSGNHIIGSVTLTNGNSNYTSQNAVLQLYKDLDNSGTYTTGDILLGTQTFPVANLASQTFAYNLTSTYTGNACPLVAVLLLECACNKTIQTLYNCDIPLPVSLVYFRAKAQGKSAVLTWETTAELNNDYFEVEHSIDAKSFETVGKIKGSGTTQLRQDYRFVDENKTNSVIHYYRLKQVDLDGKYQYSTIQAVKLEGYIGIQLTVTPNPTTSQQVKAFIDYGDQTMSNKVTVDLIDLKGNTIISKNMTLQTGQNMTSFEATSLTPGTYVITLRNDSLPQPKSYKVVIVK